jgi:hypothetical protein
MLTYNSSAASRRETWTGCQVDRPAGVRTPRASKTLAMPTSVSTPVRWISAITARVVALALAACSDLTARASPHRRHQPCSRGADLHAYQPQNR